MDLRAFRLKEMPEEAYLVPDFADERRELHLLETISRTPAARWTQLSNRRLQNWGGVPHPKVKWPFKSSKFCLSLRA